VKLDAALMVVLQDFDGNGDIGRVVCPRLDAAELKTRAHTVERLALLLGQKAGKLIRMLINFIGDGVAQLAALRVWCLRPCGESFSRGGDGVVEISRAGYRR
jgi:hypothetical protein